MQELQNRFNTAVESVRKTKFRVTDTQRLQLYGWYKQATGGNNTAAQPWAFQVYELAKWNAWTNCKNMSQEDAMTNYVNLVNTLVDDS